MKKKLLIIGNKDLTKDISEQLSRFDYIVRLNRMTNYKQTKHHTDLWLCDLWGSDDESLNLYLAESNYDKFSDVSNLLVFSHDKEDYSYYEKLHISKQVFDSRTIIDFRNNNSIQFFDIPNWDNDRITNSMFMVLYCVKTYLEEYDIYIVGIDIYDRSFLKTAKFHDNMYIKEEQVLQQLLNEHKIYEFMYE